MKYDFNRGINLCLENGIVTNLDIFLGLNLLYQTWQKYQVRTQVVNCIFWFEPGKMFRFAEPEKNVRFDPNLDLNLKVFQV